MNRRLCRMREAARVVEARPSRGFGLLEIMLMLMVLGAVLTGGFIYMKAAETSREAQVQQDLLQQADRYIAGFVARNFRLPCPATAGTGVENCTAGAVGTLPFRTLGMEGLDVHTRLGQLQYSVGTGSLMLADNQFEPHKWDNTTHDFKAVNGTDLCTKLAVTGSANAYTLTAASTLNSSGTGIGNRDLVRTAAALFTGAGCELINLSLDGMGMAVDVVDEVNSQKFWTTVTASALTAVNGIKVIVLGIKTGLAAKGLAASITTLSTASSLLATAIGTCVILIGCAEIPHAAASVAAAAVAVAAFGVAIGFDVAAIVSQAVATGLAMAVAIEAGNDLKDLTDEPMDLSGAISASLTAAQDAEAEATAREQAAASAQTAANNAATTRDNYWNTLLSDAHASVRAANAATDPAGTLSESMNDGYLVTVRTQTDALERAKLAVNAAQDDLQNAQDLVPKTEQGIADTETNISDTQTKLADTRTKLATETDPVKIKEYLAKITEYQARIKILQNALTDLNAKLVTAKQDVINKTAARDNAITAQTNAQTAYDNSVTAAVGAFCIYPSGTSCTLTDGRNQISNDLIGVVFNWIGGPPIVIDGYVQKYRDWFLLNQKYQEASRAATNARTSATDARKRYNDLVAISNGTAPAGSALSIWNGAEAMLQAADAKGATR